MNAVPLLAAVQGFNGRLDSFSLKPFTISWYLSPGPTCVKTSVLSQPFFVSYQTLFIVQFVKKHICWLTWLLPWNIHIYGSHLTLIKDGHIFPPIKVSHGYLQLVPVLAGQAMEVVKSKPTLSLRKKCAKLLTFQTVESRIHDDHCNLTSKSDTEHCSVSLLIVQWTAFLILVIFFKTHRLIQSPDVTDDNGWVSCACIFTCEDDILIRHSYKSGRNTLGCIFCSEFWEDIHIWFGWNAGNGKRCGCLKAATDVHTLHLACSRDILAMPSWRAPEIWQNCIYIIFSSFH